MVVQTKETKGKTEILDALSEIIQNEFSGPVSTRKANLKEPQKVKRGSDKKDSKKTSKTSKLENLLDSEDVAADTADSKDGLVNPLISEMLDYSSLAEEFHFEQIHYSELESSYLSKAAADHEAKYKEWETETEYLMEGSETMDEVEAEDTIHEVIYAAVLGGSEVSFDKRQRLDNWIKFNPGLFALYKETAVVRSDDVNYAV